MVAGTELKTYRYDSSRQGIDGWPVARRRGRSELLQSDRRPILAEAPTFRQNLSALMDILGGKGRPSEAATLAAWQTFFLVVPVVSTAGYPASDVG